MRPFFAVQGISRIEEVVSNRAWVFLRPTAFATALTALGVKHCMTRPYRLQTNGKQNIFIARSKKNGSMRTLISQTAMG